METLPSLLELAYNFFCVKVNLEAKPRKERILDSKVKHLLDALRFWHSPTFLKALDCKWEKIEAIPRAEAASSSRSEVPDEKEQSLIQHQILRGCS